MNKKRFKLSIKLNQALMGRKKGSKLKIDCDKDGTPIDKDWRQFVKDSPRDNCLTVMGEAIEIKEAEKEAPQKETKKKKTGKNAKSQSEES